MRRLRIDCELSLELINQKLFQSLRKLSPFGYGNPEPTFAAINVTVIGMRRVGADQKHLKISVSQEESKFDAILFNYDQSLEVKTGDLVDIVYTISENEWQGNKKLELKIKDIKV